MLKVDIPLWVAKAAFNISEAIAAPLPSPSLRFKSKSASFLRLFNILEWPGSADKWETKQWSKIFFLKLKRKNH